ncbi:MAG: methyltransferase [Candidatus Micrarchaeia archaeon]
MFFDEETKKLYKLVPTKTWPTLEISGIHMHRIKDIDPKTDTILKLKSLGKIFGNVLDIGTGLGYTAILAARRKEVKKVITIEKDKNVIEIAKRNHYSRELFTNPKIEIILGDASQKIKDFKSSFFDFVIHDPPRFSLAPELYSKDFYKELFRVTKERAKIFHYVGYFKKLQGKNYLKGIIKRLREAGFKRIKKVEYSLSLIVEKF